jgi:hypothetical protein
MIGHLGTQQMAAVSLGSLAVSFATFTFGFLVFLTTPKIAAAFVVGDFDRVSRHAAVGLWLALACGLVCTGGLVTFSTDIIAGWSIGWSVGWLCVHERQLGDCASCDVYSCWPNKSCSCRAALNFPTLHAPSPTILHARRPPNKPQPPQL